MDPTASVPLVLAGFDSAASPLRREAEQLGIHNRVYWLNSHPRRTAARPYSAAHAFLFPSLVEGFGFPVLEAIGVRHPRDLLGAQRAQGDHRRRRENRPPDGPPRVEARHPRRPRLARLARRLQAKGLERAKKFSWHAAATATLDVYRQLYPKPLSRSTEPPAKG
jgi:glycosyltransferase involved in cell wall biosynthesis